MKRRIENESKTWPDGWTYFKEEDIIYVFLSNLEKQEILITIDVKNRNYPFRPPNVSCNNKDIIKVYMDMFSGLGTYWQNKMATLSEKQCWCCDTILCKNNWVPSNKISDIIDEFKFFHGIHTDVVIEKQRNMEKNLSKIIAREYLVEDIPLGDYL